MASKDFSHMTGDNTEYVERMFTIYRETPDALSSDWKYFFDGVEFVKKFSKGTSDFEKEYKIIRLIETYRMFGHFKAKLDPLNLQKPRLDIFELGKFGLSDKDLKEPSQAAKLVLGREALLSELISQLESIYCGTFATQFEDVTPDIRDWILQEVESKRPIVLSKEDKKTIFDDLVKAEGMEKFLHTRFVGVKRFSFEGTETLLPMMTRTMNESSQAGVQELVVGMAHRGRLNILVNFMGKDFRDLLAEFDGKEHEGPEWFTGDVKYHQGYTSQKKTKSGATMALSLAYNPSHLETVNPVVTGMAWVKQWASGKSDSVLPVLIHGDAAMIGQGVVHETLQMAGLAAYNTGGTIHIAIDNQIGFTTSNWNSRTSAYCTDILKPLQVPIFHVNSDDPEACIRAIDLAVKFRMKFKKDVGIRLVGYRKHGHNEGDEPMFTQPMMYEKIKAHKTVREIYQSKTESEGVFGAGEGQKIFDAEISRLQTLLDQVRTQAPKLAKNMSDPLWQGVKEVNIEDTPVSVSTKCSEADLKKLSSIALAPPTKVEPLPKLKSVVEKRYQLFNEKQIVDWAGGELLAYASLLADGTSIRLCGQDAQRGTFSHRHSVYHDHKTGQTYNFLNDINPKAKFMVFDSLLSEYAALGFEYGISITNPKLLTIWEAQFGDFANGAQIIIDQYISAGEQKWRQMSGLVMLLPHSFEGQGPEHSSARLERFLQLCAQGNMQVCNVTTPAQLFHLLRRQIMWSVRKPLIIMSPKSLLRHPRVMSSVSDLANGQFSEALGDNQIADNKKVKRAIMCTGKVYYDLLEEREKIANKDNVALIRVEQIYPFPHSQIVEELKKYSQLSEIIWAQEEPENMGALTFVRSRMNKLKHDLGKKELGLGYIARPERSSPACGTPYRHKHEQEEILKKAFSLNA